MQNRECEQGKQHLGSPQTTTEPVNQKSVRTYEITKLYLPKSRGDMTKWNAFWDSCQSAVHRNEGISKIDRFNYLNFVLELGAAARAIQLNRSELRRSCQNYSQNVWRVPNKLSGQIWISFSRFRHVLMIARPVFDSASTRSNLCSFPLLDVARRNFGSIRK